MLCGIHIFLAVLRLRPEAKQEESKEEEYVDELRNLATFMEIGKTFY